VSFFVIGITWVNHHALFKGIALVDRSLLFLNLTLLMFIVAIPFGTATMAAYLRAGDDDAHLAAALYAAILEGMGLTFTAVFLWSIRADERRYEPLTPDVARRSLWRFGLGSVAYLAAIAVAFVSAPASLVIIALVALYYLFDQTPGPAQTVLAAPPAEHQHRDDRGKE
jgi:uncharacterized membrane protein